MTTAEIKGNKLVITLDLNDHPTLSSTGKSYLIASSGGWQRTDAKLGDQTVSINVTANIKQLPVMPKPKAIIAPNAERFMAENAKAE